MRQLPQLLAALSVAVLLAQAGREAWLRRDPGPAEGNRLRIVSEPPGQVWLVVASLHGQQKLFRGPTHQWLPPRSRQASDLHYLVESPGFESVKIDARSTWSGPRYPRAGSLSLPALKPWSSALRCPGYALGLVLGGVAGLLGWRQRRRQQHQLQLQQDFVAGQVRHGVEIGPYRVLAPLGRGGMGEVYEVFLAERPHERRALKLMHADLGGESRQRFEREVRLSLPLQHPNLVAFYDFGEWHGRPYLVMELLRGQSLELAWKDQSLGWRLARLAEAARGLEALHQRGILHRDLKPANLMVCQNKTLVMDFGIARELQGSELSQAGQVIGTPGYMAPEQILSFPLSPASDAYSLGMIAYQACAGRLAIEGETVSDQLIRQASEEATPLAHYRPDLPAEFCQWIDALLSRQSDLRPWQGLADQLQHWAQRLA